MSAPDGMFQKYTFWSQINSAERPVQIRAHRHIDVYTDINKCDCSVTTVQFILQKLDNQRK